MIPARLPWHDTHWERLEALRAGERLPHALLLRGPRGVGKRAFAARFAASLLCAGESETRPCGTCAPCHLVAAGTHPDLLDVGIAEGRREIVVDQIRALIHDIGLTARYAGFKVVVLAPAEVLNRSAANTLLKTLEEPPGMSVFILVAGQSAFLPATLRSRCQSVDFALPAPAQSLAWLEQEMGTEAGFERILELAHGAPLAARELAESGREEHRETILDTLAALASGTGGAVAAAGRWKALGLEESVYWLQAITTALILLKSGGPAPTGGAGSAMQALARTINLRDLFWLLDGCTAARLALESRRNLNEQLSLESMAIDWQTSMHRS